YTLGFSYPVAMDLIGVSTQSCPVAGIIDQQSLYTSLQIRHLEQWHAVVDGAIRNNAKSHPFPVFQQPPVHGKSHLSLSPRYQRWFPCLKGVQGQLLKRWTQPVQVFGDMDQLFCRQRFIEMVQ